MSPRKNKGGKKAVVGKHTGATSPQGLVPAEDLAGKDAPFVTEAYNRVARAAKLEGLLLISSSFDAARKPHYLSERKPDESNMNYTFNSKVDGIQCNEADGAAKCTWTWSLVASIDEKPSISIIAVYDVYYSNLLECNVEAVARFMKRVGRFTTYPYFRAHVSQVSWEASLNLPLLPTIAS